MEDSYSHLLPEKKSWLDTKSCLFGAAIVCILWVLGGVVPILVTKPWDNASTIEASVSWPLCNMNGIWTQDTQQCECYQCITGPNCTDLVPEPNCRVQATSGQPFLMQEYWNNYTKGSPPNWFYPTAPNWRGPYQNPQVYGGPANLCPGAWEGQCTGLDAQLNRAIRDLHASYNNIVLDVNDSIVISTGVTQFWSAAMWGIAKQAKDIGQTPLPMYVFERTPYYFGHPNMVDGGPMNEEINPNLVQWNTSYSLPPEQVIEVLTQPSNPKGDFYDPIYPTANKSRRIYDTVYYWPHLAPVGAPFNESVMMFSLTKLSGNAATRFGWAVVKDPSLAQIIAGYLTDNTMGPSVDIKWRALNIMHQIGSSNFIPAIEQVMKERWVRINTWFQSQTRFALLSEPNTAYIYARCLVDGNSCASVFTAVGIAGFSGTFFGDTADIYRINLTLHSYAFDILMQKLYKLTSPPAFDPATLKKWESQLPPPRPLPAPGYHITESMLA